MRCRVQNIGSSVICATSVASLYIFGVFEITRYTLWCCYIVSLFISFCVYVCLSDIAVYLQCKRGMKSRPWSVQWQNICYQGDCER